MFKDKRTGFSPASQARFDTLHPNLQALLTQASKMGLDLSILQGHRTKADQNAAVASKNSKVLWPNSKHNTLPSLAVDVQPYPNPFEGIDKLPKEQQSRAKEKATRQFYAMAGALQTLAKQMGFKLRWGGDWDGDFNYLDNSFDDLYHFELVGVTAPVPGLSNVGQAVAAADSRTAPDQGEQAATT